MRGSGAVYMAGISSGNAEISPLSSTTRYLSVILKIDGGEYRAFFSAFLPSLKLSGV